MRDSIRPILDVNYQIKLADLLAARSSWLEMSRNHNSTNHISVQKYVYI